MKKTFNEFLDKYSSYVRNVDREKALEIVKKYPDGSEHYNELIDQWYESLEKGKPNYEIYDDKYYFIEVYYCWFKYSRKYLESIQKNTELFELLTTNIRTIIDLGNGIGYSTVKLQEMFPKCSVYGTNIKNSDQWRFNQKLTENTPIKIIEDINELKENKIDLVFASEFFEHLERPIEYLRVLIDRLEPKVLIIANSFNTVSIGHFLKYTDGGIVYPREKISKKFNDTLKELGYIKVNTGFWNNRPNIWIKN